MNIKSLAAQIKDAMRIRHSALDDDIQRKIKSAVRDMEMRGVVIPKKDDILINTACELYCKAQYNYMDEGEQYMKNYENLRDGMSLSGDYNGKK